MLSPAKTKSGQQAAHANYLIELFAHRGLSQRSEAQETWSDARVRFFQQVPAISRSERFVVAGEAWLSNLQELQQHAPQRNHMLEIIADVWEKFEDIAASKLCGMYSFAVWDRESKNLSLIRDRVGSRTIYYNIDTHVVSVAPQLDAVLQNGTTRELDLVALHDYLCCAFVPGERTLWRNIREVRPGSIVQLPDKKTTYYFKLEEKIADSPAPMQEYSAAIRNHLETVVSEYLTPSNPVGVYLSGGIDSSLVAALACKQHDADVHTYSIHFGQQLPNELEFSSLVAQHIGSKHHVVEIKVEEMWNLLPSTVDCLDDPIGDPLTVPNLILGRHASNTVSTILNGEGGDPCFGGPKNQPMILNNLYRSADDQSESDQHWQAQQLRAYLASYQKCAGDIARLMKPSSSIDLKDQISVFSEDLASTDVSYLNKLMFINTKFKGADHILTKVNNLTRANSIIGLSPLFDQRLVEFSLTIPPEFKLSGAQEKAVLKEAVKDLLPIDIIERPKSGMMVPVQLWFRKNWNRQARHLLLSKSARIAKYLDQNVIKEWLDYKGDPWGRYGVKLWLLVTLELYLARRD